jgi:hypothetical protein
MSRFWRDAMQVMESASASPAAGSASNLALVFDHSGALRIVMQEGWTAEGLRAHYGAGTVYQVTHTPQGVCVEGRAPGLSCTLRSCRPAPPAAVSSTIPLYTVIERPRLLR